MVAKTERKRWQSFGSRQDPRDNVGVGLNKAEGPVKMEVRVLLPQAPHDCRQPTVGAAIAAYVPRVRKEVFNSRKERRGGQGTAPTPGFNQEPSDHPVDCGKATP